MHNQTPPPPPPPPPPPRPKKNVTRSCVIYYIKAVLAVISASNLNDRKTVTVTRKRGMNFKLVRLIQSEEPFFDKIHYRSFLIQHFAELLLVAVSNRNHGGCFLFFLILLPQRKLVGCRVRYHTKTPLTLIWNFKKKSSLHNEKKGLIFSIFQ